MQRSCEVLSFCDILGDVSLLPLDTLKIRATVDARCPRSWRLDAAWSRELTDYDLWCVWSGRGEMTIDGERVPLAPGTTLWMRPGHTHLATHDPDRPLRVRAVHFDLEPRPAERELPPIVLHAESTQLVEATLRRIHLLCFRGQQPSDRRPNSSPHDAATRWLRTLLEDLIASTATAEQPHAGTSLLHRQRLEPVMAQLRGNPAEFRGVDDLARAAGYSRGHFSRLFRAAFGQTPRDAWIDARIETATRLLRESSLSISQIADALHYANVHFFSRQYRQRTGRTPSDVRRGKGPSIDS